jgi:shikimate dehydrogenase
MVSIKPNSSKQSISGNTRVFGLVGHPVRHSLSPRMHTALFEKFGLDAVYVAFDVDPNKASRVADAIRVMDLVGVNLTVPFKEMILPDLDTITVAAEEAGAVNVVTQMDGVLVGYNTDGEGLVSSLDEEHGFDPKGAHCVILGAGGAARAIAASLAVSGAEKIVLLNRTESRSRGACEHLSKSIPKCDFSFAPLSAKAFERASESADLVVNSLGGGASGVVETFSVDLLPDRAIWVDINYWMKNPPCLQACVNRGLRTSNGLGMLVHQGALSFELFTGQPIDPSELKGIITKARTPKEGISV